MYLKYCLIRFTFDFLVNHAVDWEYSDVIFTRDLSENNFDNLLAIRGFSDGGARKVNPSCSGGRAGCGWVVGLFFVG